MSFRVQPAALDSFAQSVDALAGDAKKAKSYLETHQNAASDKAGILHIVGYTWFALRVGDQVQKNVERLAGLSAGSAQELRKCAEVYRRTEKKIAERIDQTYPKK
ncbi:hypothetical protein D0T12_11845 [Actinomadura spongiicola]|uniref:ESX-1 secretion-associated protein n=1 Tax=Actinomadura spongiicola TaxID=2303421 RepID=A0A372GJW3_9ACTN|nr:type VII secretion target [Actinomadura spongiicola]RFS85686.1 hypothetical protein D0T12_11845 [Actinomadura spongiicola]